MSKINCENEDEVIDFIVKKAHEFHSDVKISEMLKKEMNLVIEAAAIQGFRKRNNVPSGVKLLHEKEQKITIEAWNKTRSIGAVCKAVGIRRQSAIPKLRLLHQRGLIDASEIVSNRVKPEKKVKSKKAIKKYDYEVISSSALKVSEMRNRKMQRVEQLCDMRTL